MNELLIKRGLCGAPVSTDFHLTHCLRPEGHPDECLDYGPECPAPGCGRVINPSIPYGPMMPVHLDGGSAWLHRRCAAALAAEQARRSAA